MKVISWNFLVPNIANGFYLVVENCLIYQVLDITHVPPSMAIMDRLESRKTRSHLLDSIGEDESTVRGNPNTLPNTLCGAACHT